MLIISVKFDENLTKTVEVVCIYKLGQTLSAKCRQPCNKKLYLTATHHLTISVQIHENVNGLCITNLDR